MVEQDATPSIAPHDTVAWNRPDRRGLGLNLLVWVGGTFVMNGLIFGLGWNDASATGPQPSFAPPGYVIGTIWLVLFCLLATARWQLNERPTGATARNWVTALLTACLLWPLYSLALESVLAGLLGCLATLLLGGWAGLSAWRVRPTAGALVLPTVLWLCYASYLLRASWHPG